jgi:capsular exopolysaccharide synthesis family protein
LRGKDFLTRAERTDLEKSLVQLRATRDFTAPVELAVPAAATAGRVSPKPIRNILFGFFGGLVLGILLTFLRAALDRRVRGASELARDADLPLLGVLRKNAFRRPILSIAADRKKDSQVDLDALRILRTNLEHLDPSRPIRTVLVTSPLPKEGKSTVAAGLAAATALAGRHALLLEADLRRPVLAKRLGLREQPGLTDFLASRTTAREAVQAVALPQVAVTNGGGHDGSASGSLLSCITAGSPPPRHAELLGSKGFSELLSVVSRSYDTVVIDSSPLLPVVDTLQLVERVDAVVLCVRANQTTRDELNSALEALGRLSERTIGLVVTGVAPGEDRAYGYYHYAYGRAVA